MTPDTFKPYSVVSSSVLVIQKVRSNKKSTFFATIENIPSSIEDEKACSEILSNWKAFCQSNAYKIGKTGFETRNLKTKNLHFSNYWFKEHQDAINNLNQEFQALPLKEVTHQIRRGKNYKRDSNKEIPYLAPAVVRPMRLVEESLSFTSNKAIPTNPIKVSQNDIVINIIGSQRGSAALVSDGFDGFGISHHLIVIQPNTRFVNPFYLAIALNSDYVQKQLEDGSRGTVIPSLSLKSFESVYVPVPPIDIQNRICDEYKKIKADIEKKEKELNKQKLKIKNIMSRIGKDATL